MLKNTGAHGRRGKSMVTIAKSVALRTASVAVGTGLRQTQKRRALGAGVQSCAHCMDVRGSVLMSATGDAAE